MAKASATASATAELVADDVQSPVSRQVAFEYSDGYRTRAKIHKYAAFATLPLFATEFALGSVALQQRRATARRRRTSRSATGIIGLYAVQGVTGVMNLVEAQQGPESQRAKSAD